MPDVIDARDAGESAVGSRLRDAAVDPHPADFLPPTNAGEADPHGPLVVAPGIHAAATAAPIVPGAVKDDGQAGRETDAARRVLVDREDVGAVVTSMAGPDAPPAQATAADASSEPAAEAKPKRKPRTTRKS